MRSFISETTGADELLVIVFFTVWTEETLRLPTPGGTFVEVRRGRLANRLKCR